MVTSGSRNTEKHLVWQIRWNGIRKSFDCSRVITHFQWHSWSCPFPTDQILAIIPTTEPIDTERNAIDHNNTPKLETGKEGWQHATPRELYVVLYPTNQQPSSIATM